MAVVKRAEIKRPNEKLLRITAEIDKGVIRTVILSGDFFVHPEEGIESIQRALAGVKPDRAAIIKAIEDVVAAHGIEMVGISADTIAAAIVNSR